MKLKDPEENSSPSFKEKTKSLFRFLFHRKTRMFLMILFALLFFFVGHISGLILGGFFGTLDKPSEKAKNFLRSMGLQTGAKSLFVGILKENIKIPYNSLKGQFSNPEKIYIDIKFEDYQQLLYKRDQVLNDKFIFYSEEDYVPATLRYKDKELKAKLRLKGDAPENLEGDKWSMRVNIRGGESLFGMHAFSLQHPKIRGYLNEVVFHQALKREGIIGLRYNFVEIVINGKNKGIFGLEEHFDTELIEDNHKRDGVILKFYEEDWYKDVFQYEGNYPISRPTTPEEFTTVFNLGASTLTLDPDYVTSYLYGNDVGFFESRVDVFNANRVLEDPVKSQQFAHAKNLIESWRSGELKTYDVFDVDLLAKYFALVSLLGAEHGVDWANIRFYYNPITSHLEPIGFNGYAGVDNSRIIQKFFPTCLEIEERHCELSNTYYNLLFRDPVFFEKFISELERISQKEYLDKLFEDLSSDLEAKKNIIHQDAPYYHFSKDIFYNNQEQLQKILNPDKNTILAYYQGLSRDRQKFILVMGNTHHLPLEIHSASYDSVPLELPQTQIFLQPRPYSGPLTYDEYEFDLPRGVHEILAEKLVVYYNILGSGTIRQQNVLPWSYKEPSLLEDDLLRQETSLNATAFLNFDKPGKKVAFKEGVWVLNKSISIPPGLTLVAHKGTSLDLREGAMILSYSKIEFIGNKNDPVKIISSDGTGQGLAVINAHEQSTLEHVVFDNLASPSKNGWALTGAVTFYNSPIIVKNTKFSNIHAEDNLNTVRSPFELSDSSFEHSLSDCFDADFSDGVVEGVLCNACSNDCLDFSGSKVSVQNVLGENLGDKAISVGEKSTVKAHNIQVKNSTIGVASKDQSSLEVDDILIENCTYGFVSYQKKSEFGPASIQATNARVHATKSHFIEKGSELRLNGKTILGTEKNVYNALYPEG